MDAYVYIEAATLTPRSDLHIHMWEWALGWDTAVHTCAHKFILPCLWHDLHSVS